MFNSPMRYFSESTIEEAALSWLEGLGYTVEHGPEIAPGELFSERKDYDQVVFGVRLRDSLAKPNPNLSPGALDDAYRKIAWPDGPTFEARNLGFSRQLEGVAL